MDTAMSLDQIIAMRRSIRNFTHEVPKKEDMDSILASAIYAPYGSMAGLPLEEVRKIFVIAQHSPTMEVAKSILLTHMKKASKGITLLLRFLPFLKKKMQPFAEKLQSISQFGLPGLENAAYYVIVAEKKGFPPVERQSIAHAMQNMWLTATSLGLGFQLVSATGILSKDKRFLRLLGLPSGKYQLDGCLIGYASHTPDVPKQFDTEKFITWLI